MIFFVDMLVFISVGRKRIYNLNEEYFSNIDDNKKAYIVGFIYADGSINDNYLHIRLSEKDICVLKHIKNELSYDGPIRKYNVRHNSYVDLTISSSKIINDLKNIGIVKNKTYISKTLPKIDGKYFNYLLLGFFDGDGSIYSNMRKNKNNIIEYTVNFSSNYNVLSQIKKYLYNMNISSSQIRFRRDNDISCMLDIRGSINIENIYNILYNPKPNFYLKRKYDIFEEFKINLNNIERRKYNISFINVVKKLYNLGIKQKEISLELNKPYSSIRSIIQRLRKDGQIT